MKRSVAVIVPFLLLVISCADKDPEFFNKMLGDFNKHSYFIAIDIRSDEYRGRVIVENNDLYTFLNKTRGWDTQKYKYMIKKIIIHGRTLKIKNTASLSLKYIKVKEINKVYLNANKGADSFIKYYFNGRVFKYDISVDEMNAVINQLFYWRIPIKIDDSADQFMLDE
jgi:hypothetical protein